MITGANASRKLTNHISCKCECKFHCRKCNLNQRWNNDKCRCDCENKKKSIVCKKQWNPAACSCDNGKYAKSAVDNSVVYMRWNYRRHKNYSNKKYFNKFLHYTSFFNSYHKLLIFTLKKHQSKQKHVLPYQNTRKLKKIGITNIL